MRLLLLTALLGVAGVFITAAPALADTTIGQAAGDTVCGSDAAIFQTAGSVSYVVPAGNWTITSWSTQAGGASGQSMAAIVLRPLGGGDYLVVGTSATEGLTPDSVNTFGTSIPVQGGDILGIWATADSTCGLSAGGGNTYSFADGAKPSPGDTLSGLLSGDGYLMDISATLSPGAGAVIPQVDSVFLCYSSYEQDGGAVFPIDTAIGLLNAGYWVPSAIAGNVDGRTNVGAYHLQCNPPANLTPTGQYVGGGGDVVDATVATNARYGYYPIVG